MHGGMSPSHLFPVSWSYENTAAALTGAHCAISCLKAAKVCQLTCCLVSPSTGTDGITGKEQVVSSQLQSGPYTHHHSVTALELVHVLFECTDLPLYA
jgi:hypothetical protein